MVKLLLVLIFSVFCSASAKIFYTTPVKTGTHMTGKALGAITGLHNSFTGVRVNNMHFEGADYKEVFNRINKMRPRHFMHGHVNYSSELESLLVNNHIVRILVLRDPRDQVVSFAHMLLKDQKMGTSRPALIGMDLDQVMMSLITESRIYDIWWRNIHSIDEYFRSYLSWMNTPGMLVIRFEELVGSKGGGDDVVQFATMKALSQHVGRNLSDQRIHTICKNLFGGTWSFRSGQIGSWRKYFKQEHVDAFKQVAQPLLEELNYEVDSNWGI